jgi:hypothetical protein
MGSIRWSPEFCDLASEQLTVNSLRRAFGVRLWPRRTSPAGVTQYRAGDVRPTIINLRAHIIELLQQAESRTFGLTEEE